MATTGRPPKYSSPEEMQARIDGYFDDCAGTILRDNVGKAVLDKSGRPVVVGAHPPTSSGLARALGFLSRQSLLDYRARKEFMDTVTRAMLRLEEFTEERLFDRDGVQGAKFSLTNNFKGWSERQQLDLKPDDERMTVKFDVPRN